MEVEPSGKREFILGLLIFVIAIATRVGYVSALSGAMRQPPPFQVQDTPTAILPLAAKSKSPQSGRDPNPLVNNIRDYWWFGGWAPLSDVQETTAHVAPGYPTIVGYLFGWIEERSNAGQIVVWSQCALGALTAVLYLLFARLLFGNFVGFLAGVLAAIHPFWIVNVAELQDGVLATFLVACCLYLGTATAQRGHPLAGFLCGASLAGIALVRAALLPFSIVACVWVLVNCRHQQRGWLCALLVFLGFGNGLAPWTVRNYQELGTVLPVADSTFLHLWMGNNELSNGGPQDEKALRASLDPARLQQLKQETNQTTRYRMMAADVWESVIGDPTGTVERRFRSAAAFFLGAAWLRDSRLHRDAEVPGMEWWVVPGVQETLAIGLLLLLVLGFAGWHWSYGWRRASNMAALALIWIPLPYILSHADDYWGPRLPLDGVLLCYAAFALAWMIPPSARSLREAEEL